MQAVGSGRFEYCGRPPAFGAATLLGFVDVLVTMLADKILQLLRGSGTPNKSTIQTGKALYRSATRRS